MPKFVDYFFSLSFWMCCIFTSGFWLKNDFNFWFSNCKSQLFVALLIRFACSFISFNKSCNSKLSFSIKHSKEWFQNGNEWKVSIGNERSGIGIISAILIINFRNSQLKKRMQHVVSNCWQWKWSFLFCFNLCYLRR